LGGIFGDTEEIAIVDTMQQVYSRYAHYGKYSRRFFDNKYQ